MRIKRFNESISESIRDKMTPKNLNEIQLMIYNFIEEMEEKDEEDYTGEDITKIFDLIRNVKGVDDIELIKLLIDSEYITAEQILWLIQASLYNSNKQDPWHYYEADKEEVDEDNISDLLDVLKNLRK